MAKAKKERKQPNVSQGDADAKVSYFTIEPPFAAENWRPEPPKHLAKVMRSALQEAGFANSKARVKLTVFEQDLLPSKREDLRERIQQMLKVRSHVQQSSGGSLVVDVTNPIIWTPAVEPGYFPDPGTLPLRPTLAEGKNGVEPGYGPLSQSPDSKDPWEESLNRIGREKARAGKARPTGRLPDLTKIEEPRDPQQMREKFQTVNDAIRTIEGFKSELDSTQKPTVRAVELYLHQLPAIKFNSLEERQRFEESLSGLLLRLDKRLVRYDETTEAAEEGDAPSILRCNPMAEGYFRFEYFQEGKRHRESLGPNLPPLTLAPRPPDSRKRLS